MENNLVFNIEAEKLINEISQRRTSFKTESYSMSIGELVSMYKNKEIIISPEYQRLFRWTQGQKVKLIESIMLGIPLPSIFVYQDENGVWELVDGLQRVSTILQFFGTLEDKLILKLDGTKYLPSLDGFVWESELTTDKTIPDSLKLTFKRAKIDITIILSDSDPRAKFEVFQRLNTGGSNASNQEIRNNIMVMYQPDIYKWFEGLSNYEAFQNSISLTDRLLNEQYHMELLLRFIALYVRDYNNKQDVGDFLDDFNEAMITDNNFPFEHIKDIFHRTFDIINIVLQDKGFKKYDGSEFKGKFLESAFEVVAIGLSKNINSYDINNPSDMQNFENKVKLIYQNEVYIAAAGSGSNAKSRIQKLIPFAIEHFKNNE